MRGLRRVLGVAGSTLPIGLCAGMVLLAACVGDDTSGSVTEAGQAGGSDSGAKDSASAGTAVPEDSSMGGAGGSGPGTGGGAGTATGGNGGTAIGDGATVIEGGTGGTIGPVD